MALYSFTRVHACHDSEGSKRQTRAFELFTYTIIQLIFSHDMQHPTKVGGMV